MYQKEIFHCDCMYVILKNHRIKENICHSIPKGAHVQIFQLYQPFWKDWGEGVVQVSFFFGRITKFLIKFYSEKFMDISGKNP